MEKLEDKRRVCPEGCLLAQGPVGEWTQIKSPRRGHRHICPIDRAATCCHNNASGPRRMCWRQRRALQPLPSLAPEMASCPDPRECHTTHVQRTHTHTHTESPSKRPRRSHTAPGVSRRSQKEGQSSDRPRKRLQRHTQATPRGTSHMHIMHTRPDQATDQGSGRPWANLSHPGARSLTFIIHLQSPHLPGRRPQCVDCGS